MPVPQRIIGGKPVVEGTRPWIASLKGSYHMTKENGKVEHLIITCGGTIIDKYWILTAAHCFNDYRYGLYKCACQPPLYRCKRNRSPHGKYRRITWTAKVGSVTSRPENGLTVKVAYTIRHPGFERSFSLDDDIALTRLTKPLPFSRYVNIEKIKLPPSDLENFPAQGDKCTISGWGCTKNHGSFSRTANEITTPVIPNKRCSRTFDLDMTHKMCTGYTRLNTGTCPGDSGSGVVCMWKGTNYVFGVHSFSSSIAGTEPSGATKVVYYLPWIRSIIQR